MPAISTCTPQTQRLRKVVRIPRFFDFTEADFRDLLQ
jgi:hypothetical protein